MVTSIHRLMIVMEDMEEDETKASLVLLVVVLLVVVLPSRDISFTAWLPGSCNFSKKKNFHCRESNPGLEDENLIY